MISRIVALAAVAVSGYEALAAWLHVGPTFTELAENVWLRVGMIAGIISVCGWGVWHLVRVG